MGSVVLLVTGVWSGSTGGAQDLEDMTADEALWEDTKPEAPMANGQQGEFHAPPRCPVLPSWSGASMCITV